MSSQKYKYAGTNGIYTVQIHRSRKVNKLMFIITFVKINSAHKNLLL